MRIPSSLNRKGYTHVVADISILKKVGIKPSCKSRPRMNPVAIFAVIFSVFVESQLVSSMPTGDPILIGMSHN